MTAPKGDIRLLCCGETQRLEWSAPSIHRDVDGHHLVRWTCAHCGSTRDLEISAMTAGELREAQEACHCDLDYAGRIGWGALVIDALLADRDRRRRSCACLREAMSAIEQPQRRAS